jgi:adenylate cyclase
MNPMSEEGLAETARQRVAPVVTWLLEERLNIGRSPSLVRCFCERLCEIGVPVARATIHMPQLHPQIAARSLLWTRETGEAVESGLLHANRNSEAYLQSPVRHIFEGGLEVRCRIAEPDCPADFPILDDLRRDGYTDYLMLPMSFSTKGVNAIGFATKESNGFSDLDVATLQAAMPAFGAVMELNHLRRTARTLLDTYVGRHSGTRIFSGAIRRGDGEEIHAVVWYCDLRGFTALSQSQNLNDVIALLNDYFDCVAKPVEAHGGEILKFIGDAMLAIFPCEATAGATCEAADAAIRAAEDALTAIEEINHARQADDGLPIRVGIAIAIGKVMYGNIGAADRLDFTVIGPAVNLVSRLEPLSLDLERPIVVSEVLARASRRTLRPIGRFALKGIADEQVAYTLDD